MWPASLKFLAGEINFSLPFYSLNCQTSDGLGTTNILANDGMNRLLFCVLFNYKNVVN
jgi:hypothetical protein